MSADNSTSNARADSTESVVPKEDVSADEQKKSKAKTSIFDGPDTIGFERYKFSPQCVSKLDDGSLVSAPARKDEIPQVREGPAFVTKPNEIRPILLAKSGIGAAEPCTVYQMFKRAVKRNGDKLAMRVERNEKWVEWTWAEFYEQSVMFARALVSVGFQPFDSVNIIGFNSPEWFIADLGAMAAGGMAAGIYATNEPKACQYIVEHSGGKVVVAENNKQMKKFIEGGALEGTNVVALVMYDESEELPAAPKGAQYQTYKFSEFMKLGLKTPEEKVNTLIDAQRPEHCSTLIYTSGTTGQPKAVMASHDNMTWTTRCLIQSGPTLMASEDGKKIGAPGSEERAISYLPLSHIAAQMLDIHAPMILSADFPDCSCSVTFARPDALKGTLSQTLKIVNPTLFFGVPRVWEKIAEAMKRRPKETGFKAFFKRQLFNFAKNRGRHNFNMMQHGKTQKHPFGFKIANKILGTVKDLLGLKFCKVMYTAAAPIKKETLEFFGSLGLNILEVYGMSESTGPHTVSYRPMNIVGSVGTTMPGAETKLLHVKGRDKPGNGEICMRGRHVMMGYMKNQEKSAGTIDKEGWLHSGDVGAFDKDGFVHITGRIKELIIPAGGENIAPVPAENFIKKVCPCISNLMMVGDKRKYCIALATMRVKTDPDTGIPTSELEGESLAVQGSTAKTVEEAMTDPAIHKEIAAALAHYNSGQNGSPLEKRAAKIQKIAILPAEFSVPTSELGPTLKLKRPVVHEKYAELIDSVYNSKTLPNVVNAPRGASISKAQKTVSNEQREEKNDKVAEDIPKNGNNVAASEEQTGAAQTKENESHGEVVPPTPVDP